MEVYDVNEGKCHQKIKKNYKKNNSIYLFNKLENKKSTILEKILISEVIIDKYKSEYLDQLFIKLIEIDTTIYVNFHGGHYTTLTGLLVSYLNNSIENVNYVLGEILASCPSKNNFYKFINFSNQKDELIDYLDLVKEQNQCIYYDLKKYFIELNNPILLYPLIDTSNFSYEQALIEFPPHELIKTISQLNLKTINNISDYYFIIKTKPISGKYITELIIEGLSMVSKNQIDLLDKAYKNQIVVGIDKIFTKFKEFDNNEYENMMLKINSNSEKYNPQVFNLFLNN